MQRKTFTGTIARFPSPCGEKVGINDNFYFELDGGIIKVSVPLRGKGRDQRDTYNRIQNMIRLLFPSPCGEKVGINPPPTGRNRLTVCRSFRPLAGKR